MKINDWWKRYVPVRDRPRKTMQAYKPVKRKVNHDFDRYIERSMEIMKEEVK